MIVYQIKLCFYEYYFVLLVIFKKSFVKYINLEHTKNVKFTSNFNLYKLVSYKENSDLLHSTSIFIQSFAKHFLFKSCILNN